MAVVYATATGDDARRFARQPAPAGPGWNQLTVEKIERLTVLISDHGVRPQWTEFIGYDATGAVVERRRMAG